MSSVSLSWSVLAFLALFASSQTNALVLTYDEHSLPPNSMWSEIHPIKGSGGFIMMEDLIFQSVNANEEFILDMMIVPVPEACPGLAPDVIFGATASAACEWAQAGLGLAQPDGSTKFCCTQDLADAGQCNQPNRAIVDLHTFTGQTTFLSLTPARWSNQRLYPEYYDQPAGNYAVFFFNCDSTGSAKMNGKIEWESYPGGYEVWEQAELEIMGDLEQMARTCSIDTEFFINGPVGYDYDEDPQTAFILALERFLEDLDEPCTEAQVSQLNTAFDDFHSCADFDLQLLIEDLPSALLGTAIECLVTMDWEQFEDIDWMDVDQVTNIQVSPECLDFEFGDNALGHGLWKIALFPDKTMACFKEFAPKVPTCTIPTHPIPIVGAWLQPATCMAGELSSLWEDVLKVEMGVWAECLPASPIATESDCANECLYQGSILMRGGNMALPVSDTMIRVAHEDTTGNLQSSLDRYREYLNVCTTQWEGWDSFDSTSQADRYSHDDESNSLSTADNDDDDGSSAFFDVLLLSAGFFLGAVVAVAYERSKRRTVFSKETEKQLELTEKEGGYEDTTMSSADNGII